MDIFSFYSSVLDDETQFFQVGKRKMKASAMEIKQAYSLKALQNGEAYVDYNISSHRCAYLYRFGPSHTEMSRRYCRKFIEEIPEVRSLLETKSVLKICCLGGGGGSDALGILLSLATYPHLLEKLREISILDMCDGWRNSLERIMKKFIQDAKGNFVEQENFSVRLVEANLLEQPAGDALEAIRHADIICMVKFVSAVSSKSTAKKAFENLARFFKEDTIVMFIDNLSKKVYGPLCKVFASNGLRCVLGPLHDTFRLRGSYPSNFNSQLDIQPLRLVKVSVLAWIKILPSSFHFNRVDEPLTTLPVSQREINLWSNLYSMIHYANSCGDDSDRSSSGCRETDNDDDRDFCSDNGADRAESKSHDDHDYDFGLAIDYRGYHLGDTYGCNSDSSSDHDDVCDHGINSSVGYHLGDTCDNSSGGSSEYDDDCDHGVNTSTGHEGNHLGDACDCNSGGSCDYGDDCDHGINPSADHEGYHLGDACDYNSGCSSDYDDDGDNDINPSTDHREYYFKDTCNCDSDGSIDYDEDCDNDSNRNTDVKESGTEEHIHISGNFTDFQLSRESSSVKYGNYSSDHNIYKRVLSHCYETCDLVAKDVSYRSEISHIGGNYSQSCQGSSYEESDSGDNNSSYDSDSNTGSRVFNDCCKFDPRRNSAYPGYDYGGDNYESENDTDYEASDCNGGVCGLASGHSVGFGKSDYYRDIDYVVDGHDEYCGTNYGETDGCDVSNRNFDYSGVDHPDNDCGTMTNCEEFNPGRYCTCILDPSLICTGFRRDECNTGGESDRSSDSDDDDSDNSSDLSVDHKEFHYNDHCSCDSSHLDVPEAHLCKKEVYCDSDCKADDDESDSDDNCDNNSLRNKDCEKYDFDNDYDSDSDSDCERSDYGEDGYQASPGNPDFKKANPDDKRYLDASYELADLRCHSKFDFIHNTHCKEVNVTKNVSARFVRCLPQTRETNPYAGQLLSNVFGEQAERPTHKKLFFV